MRTTIEIRPEHRARLLDLAARRGEKGFSSLVAEALDDYLEERANGDQLRKRALSLRGKLRRGEAEQLRERAAKVHDFWR